MDNGTWTRGLGNTSRVPWQMAPVLWRSWLIGIPSYYLWQQGGGRQVYLVSICAISIAAG
jgi:hypothetical protein